MRIVVSGGGTAGHITPILATSAALKSLAKDVDLLYIGQSTGMEARIAKNAGIAFASIPAGKFRRLHDASLVNKLLNPQTLGANLVDSTRLVRGIMGSLVLLRRFKPDVVFIKGGYVGLPVGLAAHLLRIPYVVHESDVSPGLTNRILSKWAAQIAVGFPEKMYKDFPKDKLNFVGNPVREEILKGHRLAGMAEFGLDDKLPVIMVTGGSQGAAPLNDVVVDALPDLLDFAQIIHLTGEAELGRVQYNVSRLDIKNIKRYHAVAFMGSEIALALAAILVPNYLMAGHQVENAKLLARQGAVRVLDERRINPARLVAEIQGILGSEESQASLAKGIGALAKPDAAMDLAKLILSVGEKSA
jgi:UDP-N-acetylglucosamine--N-acetylmuramyl-(pentapeptide) pyrophosphoryl-undecaprenol N-acetylglucosamine transferase